MSSTTASIGKDGGLSMVAALVVDDEDTNDISDDQDDCDNCGNHSLCSLFFSSFLLASVAIPKVSKNEDQDDNRDDDG